MTLHFFAAAPFFAPRLASFPTSLTFASKRSSLESNLFFLRLDLFYSFSFQADLSSSTRVLKRVPFLKKFCYMLFLKVSIRLARFCSIHWGYMSFGWHEWSRMIACYVFCCLKNSFYQANDTFFIWDNKCHIRVCLQPMELKLYFVFNYRACHNSSFNYELLF